MFDQVSNTIKSVLNDRVSNPLTGSFLFSWCIWNYKILIILLSSMTPYEKNNAIDIYIGTSIPFLEWNETLEYWLTNGIVFPLLSALAYIYLYPRFSIKVYKHWLNDNKKLKELKTEVEGTILLSLEDSRKIQSAAYDNESRYLSTIASKDELLNRQNSQLETLQNENSNLMNLLTEVRGNLSKIEGDNTEKLKNYEVDFKKLSEALSANEVLTEQNSNLKDEINILNKNFEKRQEVKLSESSIEDAIFEKIVNANDETMYYGALSSYFSGKEKLKAKDIINKHIQQGHMIEFTDNAGDKYIVLTDDGEKFYLNKHV
ncbi:hypothetical protein [Shewanella seohaensis]|uniref:Uncharacterized protein n=1 Tax=Shewanella seohaensis TaxID=755175 RepID=A0ABV4VWA4_9GAMM